ncbi:hypothetical protein A0U87_23160 [Sphingobium sp. MP9-4]|nr:hypothetical protein A0U87_23160 [Sphingobium sp. MP9-4]
MVEKLGSRSRLNLAEQQALSALPHHVVEFGRDRYFSREGDRATHCSVLLSGFAMCHKITASGARQVISIHLTGDLLDVHDGTAETTTSNCQSLSSAAVALIPRTALVALARDMPAIAIALWADMGANASILAEWLLNLGRRDARARVAHLICEMQWRKDAVAHRKSPCATWPMTQEQLADATGLTAVHVNRTLQSLRREGLLAAEPRKLMILDWPAMCDAGDFTPEYLQFGNRGQSGGERTGAFA